MADLPLRKMGGFSKGTRVGTKNPKVGMVMATPTVKKGGPISQGKNRFAGITKWKCAPGQIANSPTYVLGAEWPIPGINATIKGKLSQSKNGGPIQNDKLDLPLKNPLILTTPLSFTKSIPNDHNMNTVTSVEVRPPPQHVEPHARPTSEACTTHSSQPRGVRAPLSRSHMADNAPHNTSSAIDNSKGMAQND
jgi:hypothetical protein